MGKSKRIVFALSLLFSAICLITHITMVEIYNNKNPIISRRNISITTRETMETKPIVSAAKFSYKHDTIDLNQVTTAAKMSVSVLNRQIVYQVGETLSLKIVARDANARPKLYGEDFLLAKLYTESPTKACTAGRITDYGNGTYLAKFLLTLSGTLSVSVKLLHPSEAVQVLRRVRDSHSDRRVTYCKFFDQKANISEWTECGFNPNDNVDPKEVCDFYKPAPNATWYCYKPKGVDCDSMVSCINNRTAGLALMERMITTEEAQLFNSSRVNQEVPNDIRLTVKSKGAGTEWQHIEGKLTFVSVGRSGIWGVNNHDQVYYRNGTYRREASLGTDWVCIEGSLKQISSGNNIVWAVDSNDDIFFRQGINSSFPEGTGWYRVPGKLKQVHVSTTSNRVWGVSSEDAIFRRTGITASNPAGTDWQRIGGAMKSVSVGKAGVWGVDRNDQIYYRTGTFGKEASPGTGWLHVRGGLKQIISGNDEVWGVNEKNQIFLRRGLSVGTPQGSSWQQIAGRLKEVYISSSSNQVWGVNAADKVYRLVGQRTGSKHGNLGGPLPTCGPRLPDTKSEGYWYNNNWNSLRCNSQHFSPSLSTYQCLKNKTFYILGDSTGRQYRDYLNELVDDMNAQLPDHVKNGEDIHDSIKVKFEFHNFPRTHDSNYVKSVKFAADVIDDIVGGPDMVIIISIWAHYTAVPLETFRSRVYGLRHTIERLHDKYPDTKVIWRTGTTREHKALVHYLHNSNWFAHQLVLEVKRILSGLNVYIMDVWEMSVCTNYLVHPEPYVVKNQMDLVLSYICQGSM